MQTALYRKTITLMAFTVSLLSVPLNASSENSNYVTNRSPLIEVPFTPLPLGSIKADGWLLKQLELQKDGLTGYAETLYNGENDLGPNSDWLGGTGNSWERAPYYTKGLVALAYTLNDDSLIQKAKKWINWSLDNQKANGFFGPSGNKDWWARMPMLYAIRDFYDATNDARVIPFLTSYFNYENNNLDTAPLSDWGKSRAGDNIEIVFWLYNHTGDAYLLDLADKLKNQAFDWTSILTNNTYYYPANDFQIRHNVNIPQAMKMPAIYYQKSRSDADKDAFIAGRDILLREHGQPEGLQSGNEQICGKSSLTGLELCAIVEQMQSCETAQMILGDASIGDQLEKIAFNALPGSVSKDFKGHQYYTQANQVQSKFGFTGFGQNHNNGLLPGPYSGYGCCRFNLHMGWPYFVKTMWAATDDNGLAVMAYGPNHVSAKVGSGTNVSITESTNYPFDEKIRFLVTLAGPATFPLKLRIPSWCSAPKVFVNNVEQTGVLSGAFYTVNRTWNNHDAMTVELPMGIAINNEVNHSVSVQRGPLVYSLKIQENWVPRVDYGNGFKENELFPASDWNYALVIDKKHPESSFQVKKKTMPENPFIQTTTPVSLQVKARKIPEWGYDLNGLFACDPPYGLVAACQATEQVTLVPFGAENIRITCFPAVGVPAKVTTSFSDDFFDGKQTGWVTYNGAFYVQHGEFAASTNVGHNGSKSVQASTDFSDFTYDVNVKVEGTTGDGGIIFRASKLGFGDDEYNGYYVGLNAGNKRLIFGRADNDWVELKSANMEVTAGTWYKLRVEAKGSTFTIYVDDMKTPKMTCSDDKYVSGYIGVRSYNQPARWDNIKVTALSTGKKHKE